MSDKDTTSTNTLHLDDEFDDFPQDTEFSLKVVTSTLWEEDWDDEDNQDEFMVKLRDELERARRD